jgi:lipopolysaccharide biosynthesis protein
MGVQSHADHIRDQIVVTLFNQEGVISQIVDLFCDERLGLVFAERPECLSWLGDRARAAEFASQIGIAAELPALPFAPAAALAWFRASIIRPLLDSNPILLNNSAQFNLSDDLTSEEHLDRLLPTLCAYAGMNWLTVS